MGPEPGQRRICRPSRDRGARGGLRVADGGPYFRRHLGYEVLKRDALGKRRSSVDIRTQKALAWSGPLSLVLTVSALDITGFVPLPSLAMPSPTASAEQIATFYRGHSPAICLGAIVFMLSAAVYLRFIAALSAQITPIQGGRTTLTSLHLPPAPSPTPPPLLPP